MNGIIMHLPTIYAFVVGLIALTASARAHYLGAPQAQVIQRCLEDGKLSYTDQPCPAGAHSSRLALPSPAPAQPKAPSPTADADRHQRSGKVGQSASSSDTEHSSELQRQAALAEQLRQRRLQREIQDQRLEQRSVQAARTQRQKCQRLRLAQRWAEEDVSRAPMQQRETAQRKASRGAQALALECPGL